MNYVKIILLALLAFAFISNIYDVGRYSVKEKTIVRGRSYAYACVVGAIIEAVLLYLIYVEL